jgi:hypothetical protein
MQRPTPDQKIPSPQVVDHPGYNQFVEALLPAVQPAMLQVQNWRNRLCWQCYNFAAQKAVQCA